MTSSRVLIMRVGAMGDVLHALPAAAGLRALRPEAEIGWVVDPRWAPLLVNDRQESPLLTRVHLAETKLWAKAPISLRTAHSVLNLRRELVEARYTDVIDVQGTLRSAAIGRAASAENFCGFREPREALAAHFYKRALPRTGQHVVEQNAALLGEALGVALAPASPPLPSFPHAEKWVNGELAGSEKARVALLAPTAGWGAKEWPPERFGALARALRTMGYRVLVNAARQDDPVAASVVGASGGDATPIICDLPQLIAVTRRAALVVCGDSGPLHLAASLGRPLVGLFGPTNPARNGPWGPGPKRVLRHPSSITSHKRVAEVDPGLASLGLADVVAAVEEIRSGS